MRKVFRVLLILSIIGIISGVSLQNLFPREFLPEGEIYRQTVPECVDGFCLHDFGEDIILPLSWFIFIVTFLVLFSKKIFTFIARLFRNNEETILESQETSDVTHIKDGGVKRGQLLMWFTIIFFFIMVIGAFFIQWTGVVVYRNPFQYALEECVFDFKCDKSGVAGLAFSISFVSFLISFVIYSLRFGIFPSLRQASKKKIVNFFTILAILGILLSIVFLNPLFFGICHSVYHYGDGVPVGCLDDTDAMLGLPFFWLSLGTLIVMIMLRFVSEDVFGKWRKFANRYLLFSFLWVLFAPVDTSGGGCWAVCINLAADKATASFIVTAFFVFWSGWLLFIKSRRKPSNKLEKFSKTMQG